MVKIRAICRDTNDYDRDGNTNITKIHRNPKPSLHPHYKAREYVRALNAVKLEKMHAKPFLFSLDNHTDSIKSMSKNTKKLVNH